MLVYFGVRKVTRLTEGRRCSGKMAGREAPPWAVNEERV